MIIWLIGLSKMHLPVYTGIVTRFVNPIFTWQGIKNFVMLRNEASSSLYIAARLLEEDPSLSLRMTKFKFTVMLNLLQLALIYNECLKWFGDCIASRVINAKPSYALVKNERETNQHDSRFKLHYSKSRLTKF